MLEAAADLIVEVGYHRMTLADIGERAGYSRGLATMRFGSKAGLVRGLVDWCMTDWIDWRAGADSTDTNGYESTILLLERFCRKGSDDLRRMRTVYTLMFESLGPYQELRDYFVDFHRGLHADLRAVVARGISDGSIHHAIDPDRETDFMIANLRGVGYLWALDPDRYDPVAGFAHLVHVAKALLPSERTASMLRRRARQNEGAQKSGRPRGALKVGEEARPAASRRRPSGTDA